MRLLMVVALVGFALTGTATATVQLDRSVSGQGGGVVLSGTLQIESTFGQPIVGSDAMSGWYYDFGYWATMPYPVDVEQDLPIVNFAMAANAPNPFSGSTLVRFAMPRSARVTLKVYDTRGTLVRTLADGTFNSGWHSFIWTGLDDRGNRLPNGVYFSAFTVPGTHLARKIVFLN
jgi:hypothetical protein